MCSRRVLLIGGVLCAAACGPTAEERERARVESMRAARADSVADAELLYQPATFDSITWVSPDSALARGGVVWASSCRRCHGTDGRGGGDLALQHDIEMPDLTREDWEYEGDLEAVRHRIFVGHETEMPNWGLHGLRYRDVDAVARYLMSRFR